MKEKITCVHGHTPEEIAFYGCEAILSTPIQRFREKLLEDYSMEIYGRECKLSLEEFTALNKVISEAYMHGKEEVVEEIRRQVDKITTEKTGEFFRGFIEARDVVLSSLTTLTDKK